MITPSGIIPAMVTPLDDQDRVNPAVLRDLVEHLIRGGVHGLFALGSQGEFWAFDEAEKRLVIETVVEAAGGRVPVYAGTGAVTTRESVQLTAVAEGAGADAVSVITPFYITPSDEELYEHYAAIARATRLPVLLYANPARTSCPLRPPLVARLAKIENIVGIKDSSGDLSLTAEYIRVGGEGFSVLAGRDTLILATLLYGGRGAIAATANVAPALVVSIYERFRSGDLQGALEAQRRLSPLRHAFELGTFPAVIKEALELIGIPAGRCRAPVRRLDPEKRAQLEGVLRELGLV
ncbi:MAG: 4-hydroxy-tetrahydrodipicolinate synthase [Anaerolineae bacterium]|nr:4-hydroxy-tetrahydrodipicolinate synthase [Anaerolineae bacterium]